MLAVLYMLTGTLLGWQLTGVFINEKLKSDGNVNLIWARLVSSFGVGIMLDTWLVYAIACALSAGTGAGDPLGIACMCAMAVCCVITLLTMAGPGRFRCAGTGLVRDMDLFKKEAVLYLVLLIFVAFTFHYVLHADGSILYMGYTVFSDYAPNLSLIRSFSWFENFPTQYPFFAGQDIKYHFMFMFLCGNLERMGLPLCIAYNLPSVLGLTGFLVMLTQFARRVTGRFAAEVIVPFLFVFRSGLALFYFIAEHLRAGDLISAFRDNTVFIGYTPNEGWGLWNYNVYLNQRHLGFGLLVAMAVIWYYYGYLEEADGETSFLKGLFFSRDAWAVKEPVPVIMTGFVLGMLSFWNGACVIGSLLVLAGFALFSRNKLDFLGLAVLTVSLSFMQTRFFIDGSAVSPAFYWGFISSDTTVPGVLWFLVEISGLTIAGALFAAIAMERKYRVLIFAFLLPVIFSFTMSLTPDVTVNHKYIMMSMAFLSVIWAELLIRFMGRGSGPYSRVFAVFLAVILMSTGLYDFVIIIRNNGPEHEFAVDTESDLGHYLRDNLTWDDMVLSGPDSVSNFTVSGCRMYTGWPYYAWSAGYDTDYRFEKAKYIYTVENEEELLQILEEEDITYILFESGLVYDGVAAREDVIARTLRLAYESEDKKYRLYQVP